MAKDLSTVRSLGDTLNLTRHQSREMTAGMIRGWPRDFRSTTEDGTAFLLFYVCKRLIYGLEDLRPTLPRLGFLQESVS